MLTLSIPIDSLQRANKFDGEFYLHATFSQNLEIPRVKILEMKGRKQLFLLLIVTVVGFFVVSLSKFHFRMLSLLQKKIQKGGSFG